MTADDEATGGHTTVWLQSVIGSPPPDADVDCMPRLPLCRAACCHFRVALTRDEVEMGRVSWDPDDPYLLPQSPTGGCAHLDVERGCTVYDDRPIACRAYTCADDRRVWLDFDRMIPNREWLDANLGGDAPQRGV